jgi:hypothetical protein
VTEWQTFLAGIAPDHVSALLAALALPVLLLTFRRRLAATIGSARSLEPDRRWAFWLLGLAAVVHLALPLGHVDGPVLAVLFVADGAGFGWLAIRVVRGRSWRLLAAPLLVATLVAYLVVTGGGAEEPDQVGIATAVAELAALGLCLVPARDGMRRKRLRRLLASTATVATVFGTGAVIWVGSFLAHAGAPQTSTVDSAEAGGAVAVGHSGGHDHDYAARAQAGVIMAPRAETAATPSQRLAAALFAARTRDSLARYARLSDALAAGYRLPRPGRGTDVHVENPGYRADGRVLDPLRPETLVYAIDDRGATLLGAMFVMDRAGVPGPAPGGPITRWHAHNLCITVLPLGFGIVTPFGSCPALALNLTSPEMMHVWVVPDPGGPYADGLDRSWVLAYHAAHAISYP